MKWKPTKKKKKKTQIEIQQMYNKEHSKTTKS